MEGIEFTMDQIAAGIIAFAPVLTGDLDAFRELLLNHQLEEDEEDEFEGDMFEDDADMDDDDGAEEENDA